MAKRPTVCAAIADALGGQPPPIGAASALALKLGRDKSVVSRWVAGTSTPDAASWPDIEAALDMEPGTLSRAALGEPTTPLLAEQLATAQERIADLVDSLERLELRVAAIEQGRHGP